jgi:hypothetical protein
MKHPIYVLRRQPPALRWQPRLLREDVEIESGPIRGLDLCGLDFQSQVLALLTFRHGPTKIGGVWYQGLRRCGIIGSFSQHGRQNLRSDIMKTYMVCKEKITGNVTITSTMAFTCKMAPLIVLAPNFRENAKGQKEYAEHFEVVIFNEGVNIWRYFVTGGKLAFRKAAFANFPLQKDTKYLLEVKKVDKTLTVSVAGHTLGYFEDALPASFYVGITGCEGLNRFYDFTVRR